jgi:hypothetical protein
MISLGAKQLSLLDSVHHHNIDYWVVFRQIERERSWLWKFLKPGFYHVEVWGYVPPGAWIRFDTCVELISVEVYADPPWMLIGKSEKPTFMHYIGLATYGRIRQKFYIGPVTCVSLAAAFLGVRLPFWCRTPFQLYKLLKKGNRIE